MNNDNWRRVSRRFPCPICQKFDWCTYTGAEDSPGVACCMRTESDRPMQNGGWLHKLQDADPLRRPRRRTRTVPTKRDERPIRDFGAFARQCHLATLPPALGQLADTLGVTRQSLARLCVGLSPQHGAWTFPMSNPAGQVVGVRLRLPSGRKLSVKGGREALFLPDGLQPGGRLLVCEGPSDCAACLDWGLSTIGRPSCSGGIAHIVELVKRLQPADVVILADADPPGQRGAERLAGVLVAYVPGGVRVITPPREAKDARAWLRAGGTRADVLAAINAAPVRRLKVTTRKKGK